jgi:hypothetical protein
MSSFVDGLRNLYRTYTLRFSMECNRYAAPKMTHQDVKTVRVRALLQISKIRITGLHGTD